jgi:hypothetical protein
MLLLLLLLPSLLLLQGKVPRASYDGTVVVRCRGRRLFLVLKSNEAWRLP